MRPLAPVLAALVLATALAGCLGASQELAPQGALDPLAPVAYDTSRGWSVPLTPALYEMLEGVKQFVPSFDGVELAVGIFRPAIEGCDWDASELPAHCQLPAVMDAGPYYGDRVAIDKFRPPTIEWLVPRGYAVLQMSLRGTGESGGCMEYKSPKDVDDISAVIDWIAAQPWSNGNVGMIGRSYDGTSAWAGAASGNPHLKAIVPISGAVDAPGMYFKNGTAETRMLVPHIPIYWAPYALGLGDRSDPVSRVPQWTENVCQGVVDSQVEGTSSYVTGDASSDYWQERNLVPRILESYQGAIWVIHGLHDWNVNPSQAVPLVRDLQAAGIPTKAWLGVWGHAYPDRVDEHRNVRWDWAEQTVRFFDFYLKGEGPAPAMDVEVEDSLFVWRREATYPPADATMRDFELVAGGALAPPGEGDAGMVLLGSARGMGNQAAFTSEPLEAAVRVAGLPQVHVTATPTSPLGGWLFAELYDVYPDGRAVRLTWAAIDLRYHAGGNTEPATLLPGEPVVAQMQFEPLDAMFGEGHRVRVVLHRNGVEDIGPSPDPAPVEVSLGDGASLLRLPAVERPSVLRSYIPPGMPAGAP